MNKQRMVRLVKAISETGFEEGTTVSALQSIQIKFCEKEILKELNSKPVMPKVFDDWYIQYGTIEDFMFSFVDSEQGNELESSIRDLFMWLYDESLMINSKKLSRCIEAIQAGDYEVEK